MTVGDAPLTTDAPVEFDFQEPNGWLRVDLDYLLPNLSVAIGIRDSEDAEWTWSHLKRTDGVITTGKAKFAKVKVFYATETIIRYAGGYLRTAYDGTVCNKLFMSHKSDNYQLTGQTVDCFVSGSVKEKITLRQEPGKAELPEGLTVETYKNGKAEGVTVKPEEARFRVFALKYVNADPTPSNINISSDDSETKMWGSIDVNEGAPRLTHKTGVYTEPKEGTCVEHDVCGDDIHTGGGGDDSGSGGEGGSGSGSGGSGTGTGTSGTGEGGNDGSDGSKGPDNKKKTTIIVVSVVVSLLVVGIILVLIFTVGRRNRVCNADAESSSSTDGGDTRKKSMGQADRPRHKSSNVRKLSETVCKCQGYGLRAVGHLRLYDLINVFCGCSGWGSVVCVAVQ